MKAIFYDPHPGLAGCSERLPDPVKTVADWLDGKVLEVSEAVELISQAVQGESEYQVAAKGDYIALGVERLPGDMGERYNLFRKNWRVVRYIEEPQA